MISVQLHTSLKSRIYQLGKMYSLLEYKYIYIYIVTILVTIDGVCIGNRIY
jgi:hypothetical protein